MPSFEATRLAKCCTRLVCLCVRSHLFSDTLVRAYASVTNKHCATGRQTCGRCAVHVSSIPDDAPIVTERDTTDCWVHVGMCVSSGWALLCRCQLLDCVRPPRAATFSPFYNVMIEHRSEQSIIPRQRVVLRVIRRGGAQTQHRTQYSSEIGRHAFLGAPLHKANYFAIIISGPCDCVRRCTHTHTVTPETHTHFIIAGWLCSCQPVNLAKGSSLSIWPGAIRARGNFISSTPSPSAAPRMRMIRCGQFGCVQSKLAVDRSASKAASHNCQP